MLQPIAMNWDGILHRATINLGAEVSDTSPDAATTAKPGRLAFVFLPDSDLVTAQVSTGTATTKVAYSCASRASIAHAIAEWEAGAAVSGDTVDDLYALLTSTGSKVSFIPWSLGEIPAGSNAADFFEAPVTAVLLLVSAPDQATPDTSFAFVHLLAK